MKLRYCLQSLIFFCFFCLMGCATYKKQISETFKNWKPETKKKASSSIYLIGDAGNSLNNNQALQNLAKELALEDSNSTVLFLGDNVYPRGIANKKNKSQVNRLNAQLNILKNYKGKTIFIPGNHDWYHGLKGLKTQEKLVEKALGKNSFLPENGCPLSVVSVNKNIDIIIIDSQWYLTDWNQHPEMNDRCDEIKTRKKFFVELEGLLNKSQNKVTLIAMHHPITSRGTHAGFTSFQNHLFPFGNKIPLPIIGTLLQTIRKTSGLNPQDLQAYRYNELVQRITTLAKEHPKLIFVSGHEHNLQYVFKNGIPQIISGSGSKTSPTYLGNCKGFSYGQNGYVKLSIDAHQTVIATFKSKQQTVFETIVFNHKNKTSPKNYQLQHLPDSIQAPIYSNQQTNKSKFYTLLWGQHYRDQYSIPIKAKTVNLDTLYGGLQLVKKGGGHQSKSLRLVNPEGKQYVMRALKKSAIRFLQTVAFQKEYIAPLMEDTYTEDLLYDFYTSAHPYTPFVIEDLAASINVYHTNPKLFYVPKQNALAPWEEEFGDALYLIEERPEKHHKDLSSFGMPADIISTDDLFAALRKSNHHQLDEKNYVTARLFDMILGDWDRHVDQWRWAVFKEGKKHLYRPIPRDRDQAFSNYDGFILSTLTTLVDPVKLMQSYQKNIRNLFKFNDEPYPMDVSLIQKNEVQLWSKQAIFIQQHLTDEIIENAFLKLPKETQNTQVEKIKTVLKYRRDHLLEIAQEYQKILEKFVLLKGTDKKELFEITGDKATTTITVYSLHKGKKDHLHFSKTFNNKKTKEIWIYGLDDDDEYLSKNLPKHSPKIRLIGGQNKDRYAISNSKNIIVHDFKSKKNKFQGKFKKRLTNQYAKNVYTFRKVKDHTQTLLPIFSYNPDDGFNLGLSTTFTNYGFNQQPFTNKHSIAVKFYTATNGFDVRHSSEFATYFYQWNAFINTRLTSANFSNNFFGFGNNTPNVDAVKGLNYNRVKTEIKKVVPGMVWNNLIGSSFKASIPFQIYKIEATKDRYIQTIPVTTDNQYFIGLHTAFTYTNFNSKALPTLGFSFFLAPGWEYNLSQKTALPFVKTAIGIIHPLTSNHKWAIASKIRAKINFEDNFEPYQAAFIGGNNGLRGFRNERFSGKSAYTQNTDIQYTIRQIKTPLLPLTYGVSIGFDYGRVWFPSIPSSLWHTSYGGSFWLSIPGITKTNFNFFNSKEGIRFTFGVGVNW